MARSELPQPREQPTAPWATGVDQDEPDVLGGGGGVPEQPVGGLVGQAQLGVAAGRQPVQPARPEGLTDDAILRVRGQLDKERDTPQLRGQEVTVPDLDKGADGPVVISLPSTRCTGPVVQQLRDVLGTHPGVTEVRLRLLTRNATKVMRLDDRLRVTPSPALFADLKQLLGPGCLAG